MSLTEPMITLLILLTLAIFLTGLLAVVRYIRQQQRTPPAASPEHTPRPTANSAIIDLKAYEIEGNTVAEPVAGQKQSRLRYIPRAIRRAAPRTLPRIPLALKRRQMLVIAVGATLAALGGIYFAFTSLPEIQRMWRADQFVVVVAPFDDGTDGSTGAAVARELKQVLEASTHPSVSVIGTRLRPANEQQARELAHAYAADVLIWGYTNPGETLNRAAMLPRITFQPSGQHTPYGWADFTTRLEQPVSYPLAITPINGRTILPTLIDAMYRYSKDNPDQAYIELGVLLDTYPLHPALPHTLRGNVNWARGQFAEAATEYRAALRQASPEQARIAHNLWVALLDAGDTTNAAIAFNQATMLAGTTPLPALHINLGQQALAERRAGDARKELDTALRILKQYQQDPTTGFWVTMARACRETGDLACATNAVNRGERRRGWEVGLTTANFRRRLNLHLEAALQQERGLIALTRLTSAPGRLLWSLEASRPLPANDLRPSGERLQSAVQRAEERLRLWDRAAAARAAEFSEFGANEAGIITVETGQQRRAAADLRVIEANYALHLVEADRAVRDQSRGIFAAMWNSAFQVAAPLTEARRIFTRQLEANADDPVALLGDARALRVRNNGEPDLSTADQHYNRLIELLPTRPEPVHGKGAVALLRGDRNTARQFFLQALQLDNDFFPAHAALMRLELDEANYAGAIEHLRVLVRLYPRPQYILALASALRELGPANYPEAVAVLDPLLQEPHAGAWTELGRIRRDTGQIEQALDIFATALDLRQGTYSAEAMLEMGLLQIQQGTHNAAERNLLNAVNKGNERTQLYAHLALSNLYTTIRNDYRAALPHFEAVINTDTTDVTALIEISDQLRRMGETNSAFDALARARRVQPDNPDILVRLAQIQLDLNNRAAAEGDARQVLNLTNDGRLPWQRSTAQIVLGDLRRLQGDFAGALEWYEQARATDPNNTAAYIAQGLVYVGQDNWAVASGYFEQAVNLPRGQGDPLAHFWYAEALLRQGNPTLAITHYQQAIALQGALPLPAAWLGMAQAYLALGNTTAAADSIAVALEQDPTYTEAWLFKGKLAEAASDTNAALKAYNTVIDQNRNFAEAFLRRGLISMERSEYSAAVRDFEQVTILQPDNPTAHYWLGRARLANGDLPLAIRNLQRATELSDDTLLAAQLYQALAIEQVGDREQAINLLLDILQTTDDPTISTRAREELLRIQGAAVPNSAGGIAP